MTRWTDSPGSARSQATASCAARSNGTEFTGCAILRNPKSQIPNPKSKHNYYKPRRHGEHGAQTSFFSVTSVSPWFVIAIGIWRFGIWDLGFAHASRRMLPDRKDRAGHSGWFGHSPAWCTL